MATPSKCDFIFETDGDLWTIGLLFNGRRHRALTGMRHGARILLSDIEIESAHLKNRGVGSQLLGMLIAKARSEGIAEIHGSVTQDDITNTPYLLDWYQRHGFVLSKPDQECIPNSITKIVLKLK